MKHVSNTTMKIMVSVLIQIAFSSNSCLVDHVIKNVNVDNCSEDLLIETGDSRICFDRSKSGCICELVTINPILTTVDCVSDNPMWSEMALRDKDPSIIDIIWIGSHNSGSDRLKYSYDNKSYSFGVHNPYNDSICNLASNLGFNDLIRKRASVYASDQLLTIWQQLLIGVRVFDLDVGKDEWNRIRITHCLWGRELKTLLYQIKEFITSRRNELVIIRISDGIVSSGMAKRVSKLIYSILNDLIIFVDEAKWPYKIKELIKENRRILIVSADRHGVFSSLHPPYIHTTGVFCDGGFDARRSVDEILELQLSRADFFVYRYLNFLHLYCQRSLLDLLMVFLNPKHYQSYVMKRSLVFMDELSQRNLSSFTLANVFLFNHVNEDTIMKAKKLKKKIVMNINRAFREKAKFL